MQPRVQPEAPSNGLLSLISKRVWWSIGIVVVCIPLLYVAITQYIFYYVPEELPPYTVTTTHNDDTLRIAIIGDSWAMFHSNLSGDTITENAAKRLYGKPFKSSTRGWGGALSKVNGISPNKAGLYCLPYSDKRNNAFEIYNLTLLLVSHLQWVSRTNLDHYSHPEPSS